MMGTRARVWGVVVAAGAALAGCGSDKSNGGGAGLAGSAGAAAGGAGAGGAGGAAGSATVGGGGSAGTGGKAPHVPLVLGVAPPTTGMFTDERDQTQYGWVELDGVKWMSENLRFVLGKQELQSCYFDVSKLADDCSVAGYFYGWSAAMGLPHITNYLELGVGDGSYQGVCPAGWHLPTRAEWLALLDYVNQLAKKDPPQQTFGLDYPDISDPLLSAMGWTGGYGTNELGFDAKPFARHSLDSETSFWGSDETGRQFAASVKFFGNGAHVDQEIKVFGHAVRCIEGAATKPAPVTTRPPLSNTTGTFTDARDAKSYATVQIGTQEWFAQNLDYEPATGDSACYADQAEHCRLFGRMYGYETAHGVCPGGWHIPSVAEWHTLAQYVDDNSVKTGVTTEQGSFTWQIGSQIVAPWEVWQDGPKEPPPFGFNGLPGGWAVDGDQSGSLDHEQLLWTAKGATADEIAVKINDSYLSTAPVRTSVQAYVRCLHD